MIDFILSCMATTGKSVLGGFFICIAIILLGLVAYGFNYVKNYIKDKIEERQNEHFADDR